MKHIAYSFLFLSLVASSLAQELRSDINLSDPFSNYSAIAMLPLSVPRTERG